MDWGGGSGRRHHGGTGDKRGALVLGALRGCVVLRLAVVAGAKGRGDRTCDVDPFLVGDGTERELVALLFVLGAIQDLKRIQDLERGACRPLLRLPSTLDLGYQPVLHVRFEVIEKDLLVGGFDESALDAKFVETKEVVLGGGRALRRVP